MYTARKIKKIRQMRFEIVLPRSGSENKLSQREMFRLIRGSNILVRSLATPLSSCTPTRSFYLSLPQAKLVQFILSDIGEGIREVNLKEWFVKPGDKIAQFDDVCLVESDKASVNITSRFDGTVAKLWYEEGTTALVGKPLIDIDVPEEEGTSENTSTDAPETERKDLKTHEIDDPAETNTKPLTSPAVRRLAKENKISLGTIKGTGKNGRISKEDVIRFLDQKQEDPQPIKHERILRSDRIIPITGIQKAMAKSMVRSHAIPSFGFADEVDMTQLVQLKKEIGEFAKSKKNLNLTYTPFFIKALSKSLEEFPELNGSVDDNCENVIQKAEHNIGVAVDTSSGLVVPNVKNVQGLSILDVARELDSLTTKAKEMKLSPMDFTGGTFTLSNVGVVGGTYTRPLINPPELAILALGRIQKKPIFNEKDELVRAQICSASWVADHRVVDGATLARFANLWRHYIEHPNFLILDL